MTGGVECGTLISSKVKLCEVVSGDWRLEAGGCKLLIALCELWGKLHAGILYILLLDSLEFYK